MSEDTKKMCEVAGGLPSEQRIKELLLLFKQQIQIKFTRSNDAYCTLAPGGVLGYRQISDFLRSCSCTITEDEALLLVHNLVPSCSGIISFDDFLDLINVTSSEHMDEASLTSRSVKNVSIHKDDSLKHVAHEAEKARRRRRLAIELRQKLIQRRGTTQEQFRLFGCHNSASRLNRDTFRRSLNEIMHFNVPKEDEDTLVSILFDGRADEKGDITYKQFQEFIDLNDMY
ncbi:unnamed protein product [Trypanosoma congolense IL3000]|nr:unnamed protein product [Trypanosoma congolense IL3000]